MQAVVVATIEVVGFDQVPIVMAPVAPTMAVVVAVQPAQPVIMAAVDPTQVLVADCFKPVDCVDEIVEVLPAFEPPILGSQCFTGDFLKTD